MRIMDLNDLKVKVLVQFLLSYFHNVEEFLKIVRQVFISKFLEFLARYETIEEWLRQKNYYNSLWHPIVLNVSITENL